MAGKKRSTQHPENTREDMSESRPSLKKNWNSRIKEFHQAQRKVNSLVESGDINAESSSEIIENLDNLIEQLNEVAEALSERTADQDERDDLWLEIAHIENEARETIRFANKAVRAKLST